MLMVRFLLTLLLAALSFPANADPDFGVLMGLTSSLLKVEAVNPDGSVSIGTGVVVAPGMVVTNCHVTQHAQAIELVKGGEHALVQSQEGDMDRDLCLLHAPGVTNQPIAHLRESRPRLGEEVYAIGYIFGVSPRFNRGEVNALYDYQGGRVIQSTTPFSSGASGGGLFDDQGRLVGIVTFKYRSGTSYHFSLPVKWVTEALKSYHGKPVGPLEGMPFWQRPGDARPFFLRAPPLEAENDWQGLADLARQWSDAEPRNPSSWFTLGKAHQQLKQHDQCIDAYRRAVALDARYSAAWYGLALAYYGSGDTARAAQAQRTLQDLDPRLAADLARAERECGETPQVC